MLGGLELFSADETVYRFAKVVDFSAMLGAMGFEAQDLDEILDFLGESRGPSDPEHLLDAPFAAKPQLAARKMVPTRFSDGSLRVFYSALELETAESEVLYWYAGAALGDSARVVYYDRLSCRFRGPALDLRPMVGDWPFLIADDTDSYSRCQALANEGLKLGVDGFFTPSARRPTGTNVPTFRREALSEPEVLGITSVSRDAHAGAVRIRRH